MTCATCGNQSSRVRIVGGKESCGTCGGFSEANGSSENVMTRSRVRSDAVKYEGDTINPWAYSKVERKFVPSDEFLKFHGSNAMNFFRKEDVEKTHPKLAESMHARVSEGGGVESVGKTEEGVKAALNL